MKLHKLLPLAFALCLAFNASAQTSPVDSTLLGADILTLISQKGPGSATVNQSPEIRNALSRQVVAASNRKLQGYRVRIFFGNDQSARSRSESIAQAFAARHPDVGVYRSHVSPYFKVTVGDFRTQADAQWFASRLIASGAYQTAFVVKEQINYPGF